jgi:hypothetical protein
VALQFVRHHWQPQILVIRNTQKRFGRCNADSPMNQKYETSRHPAIKSIR